MIDPSLCAPAPSDSSVYVTVAQLCAFLWLVSHSDPRACQPPLCVDLGQPSAIFRNLYGRLPHMCRPSCSVWQCIVV